MNTNELARHITRVTKQIDEAVEDFRSQQEDMAFINLVGKGVEFTAALHPISGPETLRGKIRHIMDGRITIEFTNPLNGQLRTHECTADGGRVRIVQG